jgi:hypothetical protein
VTVKWMASHLCSSTSLTKVIAQSRYLHDHACHTHMQCQMECSACCCGAVEWQRFWQWTLAVVLVVAVAAVAVVAME